MGDNRRFDVMHSFILRNYPKAQSILCVADGKGDLARLLQNSGKNAQVIDPVYNSLYFTRKWKHKCDLIVGLHPDEATAEIVMVGERLNIPYVIVPCCIKGTEAELLRSRSKTGKVDFHQWITHLEHLSRKTLRRTNLPINGMSLVLFK